MSLSGAWFFFFNSAIFTSRLLLEKVNVRLTVKVVAETNLFKDNMVKSSLHVGVLLVVVCMADGQSTKST